MERKEKASAPRQDDKAKELVALLKSLRNSPSTGSMSSTLLKPLTNLLTI